ncbi:hypothetical protein RF11_09017 [Thelohanellus kitauei]|uniref:Uncharacterized protein n=1 Tax=Thelohanellus kitauei TaxID=669202 RepID=A0A0C2IXV8_THEKT|nr:hypothetical protein RF11_09017 [Thelohanellus kitauei]
MVIDSFDNRAWRCIFVVNKKSRKEAWNPACLLVIWAVKHFNLKKSFILPSSTVMSGDPHLSQEIFIRLGGGTFINRHLLSFTKPIKISLAKAIIINFCDFMASSAANIE